MSILPIVYAPDKRLCTACEPIAEITQSLRLFIDNMKETLIKEEGVGLAAPQVGLLKRIFIMDVSPDEKTVDLQSFLNPEILEVGTELVSTEQGCLSILGASVSVERPEWVRVTYQDATGTHHEKRFDGMLAVCFQHELDHLNGKLMTDYLPPFQRRRAISRAGRLKKSQRQ
jgi:peptide deformylase